MALGRHVPKARQWSGSSGEPQHTSAYVRIRPSPKARQWSGCSGEAHIPSAPHVAVRDEPQHTSAYVRIRQHTSSGEAHIRSTPHVAVRDVRDSAEVDGNLIHVPK